MNRRLTEKEYIDHCWTLTEHYINGVRAGEIKVGKYIKLAIERYKTDVNRTDLEYKVKKVDKVFAFFSYLNIELNNEWVQFPLMDWQCFFISAIFGFYLVSTDKRKYNEGFLFIGKGNGKTPFASALQLYGMLWDGMTTPQSLLIANTGKQALNALNYAKGIILNTSALRPRLIGQRYRIIFDQRKNKSMGFCEIMSAVDPARLHGYRPTMAIIDEIHGFKDGKAVDAIRSGIEKTFNSLMLVITTAGNKDYPYCQEYLEYHKKILEGSFVNETAFGLIYQIDPEDDIADSNCWIKSNPSLGTLLNIEDMEKSFNNAIHSLETRYEFYTMRLNIFWETPDTWIPEDVLAPCFKDIDMTKLAGRECWVGMDLSRTSDLTSIVLFFYIEEEDKFISIPYFWFANRPKDEQRKNGRSLTTWIRDGLITKCKTQVIDLDQVFEKILELNANFSIQCVYYDRYNAIHLNQKLKDAGIPCQEFPQTAMRFNAPLKMLEQFIYEQRISFANNPVLLWNFSNVVLYPDANANIKIDKKRQMDAVDGVVALAMSMGGFIESKYGEEILGLNQYLNIAKK